MRTLLLLLILTPLIGMAQLEKIMGQSLQSISFWPLGSIDSTKDIQPFLNRIDDRALSSSYLKTDIYNRILQDSSHYTGYLRGTVLDSNYSRTYYNYDSIGNLVVEYSYEKCHTCADETVHKTEYQYDANGERILIVKYEYVNRQYIPTEKTENEYDLTGRLIHTLRIIYTEDKPGQFVNYRKDESNYDGNNLSYISSTWDTNKNEWVFNLKAIYHFDENWKEVSREWSHYYNNRWVNELKLEKFYAGENVSFLIESNWSESNGQWENTKKVEYSYNLSGKQTKRLDSFWNSIKHQWIANEKEERSYNTNGKIVTIGTFHSDTTSEWIANEKEEHIYDTKENKVITNTFYWDQRKSQWINEYKYDYNYTAENRLTLSTQSFWDKTSNQWIPNSRYEDIYDPKTYTSKNINWSWDSTTNQWMINFKMEYFYSNHGYSDGPTEPETGLLKIYPNPFQEFFIIENKDTTVTQCQLFNSNGKLIETLPVMQGVTKYIFRDLNIGLYMIKIKTGQEVKVKKIIKR